MNREFKISLSQECYSDVIYLSQYDDDYSIVLKVTNKYSPASISGYSYRLEGTRPDGLGFALSGTVSGHKVTIPIDTTLTACAGASIAELVIYDGNGFRFGSANVQIIVEPAAHPDSVIDADEDTIRGLAAEVQEIVDTAAEQVAESLVDVQEDIEDINSRLDDIEAGGSGISSSVKQAILALLKGAVYTTTGFTDEIATVEAWANAAAPLTSIAAVYSGGTVRVGASLDSLRSDLVVTATYADSSTAVITDYTLSGTLTEGTSTITVSYGGKTTTFTVTVVSGATLLYSWDLTDSLTDSVGGKVATTTGTQDSTGLHFTAGQKYIEFPAVYAKDRTYEIDVTSILKSSPNSYGRLFMVDSDSATGTGGAGYILTGAQKGGDLFYNESWETSVIVSNSVDADGSYYDGSTVSFYIDEDGYISVYKDGTLLGTSSTALSASYDGANVYFGSSSNNDALYNATFTAFRVYDGNKYGGA